MQQRRDGGIDSEPFSCWQRSQGQECQRFHQDFIDDQIVFDADYFLNARPGGHGHIKQGQQRRAS